MPLPIARDYPTFLIRRQSFERAGLTRSAIDDRFGLTADEFRVEGDLIAIGPLVIVDVADAIGQLEGAGLAYFDDFFELSGNWPEWLGVYAAALGR